MSIQLHHKQIVILGLAMLLAVASYWIPVPQKPVSSSAAPDASESSGHVVPVGSVAFEPERVTAPRFSVTK